jgi:hypothetical protein
MAVKRGLLLRGKKINYTRLKISTQENIWTCPPRNKNSFCPSLKASDALKGYD